MRSAQSLGTERREAGNEDQTQNQTFDTDKITEEVTRIIDELKKSRQKPVTIELGTKIIRAFDGEDYVGQVIQLPSEDGEFYKILYEDDDEEDLTVEEIQPYIAAYNKKMKAAEVKPTPSVNESRKRDRPKEYQDIQTAGKTEHSGANRRRGRPSKTTSPPVVAELPRRKGRPPKRTPITEPELPRQRGRSRKRQKRENEIEHRHETTSKGNADKKRKRRGRPRKQSETQTKVLDHDDSSVCEEPKKRGRGRPRKQIRSTKFQPKSEQVPIPDISEEHIPKPGHVDEKMTYYCTMENDSSARIASLLGCESWLDVAYVPENMERFPALQNKKVKFRRGTLVRIAECNFALKKVAKLVEE